MFDNLMQNVFLNAKNKLEEEKKSLKDKIIEYSSSDDNIKIKINANSEILDLVLSPNILNGDKEMLEDLLIVNINKAINEANALRDKELESLKENILPDINDIMGSFGDFVEEDDEDYDDEDCEDEDFDEDDDR